jgi:hypothetical protein
VNDVIVGAAALILWLAGIVVTGLVIRASFLEYRARRRGQRRAPKPRSANATSAYIDDDTPFMQAFDLDASSANGYETGNGHTDDFTSPPTPRPASRAGVRVPDGSKSLDSQINELALGTDDQMQHLIRSIRGVAPSAAKSAPKKQPRSAEESSSKRATKTHMPSRLKTPDGVGYVVVDDEGRPQTGWRGVRGE